MGELLNKLKCAINIAFPSCECDEGHSWYLDGNLVAVTSDGMARRVSEMIDEARSGAEEVLDKKSEPVRLSKDERTEYLAGGLFAGIGKRKAFNEALEGFRR